MPRKRKEIDTCGNPLFLKWLGEWMESASAANNKAFYTYKKAYDSMSKYPLPFQHPAEAAILSGIGPGICQRLEMRLKQHCEETGQPIPQRPDELSTSSKSKKSRQNSEESLGFNDEPEPEPKRQKTTAAPKAYVPKYRSGAYAIMLALYKSSEIDSNFSVTKTDLIKEAQRYCDASFDIPSGKQKFYTAWNSMKTLLDKNYVCKNGYPSRFSLTESGMLIARQMVQTASLQGKDPFSNLVQVATLSTSSSTSFTPSTALNNFNPTSSTSSSTSFTPSTALNNFNPIAWEPGTFEIVLILDTREVKLKKDRDYIKDTLQDKGVSLSVRNLELGDVIWVARKNTAFSQMEELVLDYILERKRMDDLVGSIKDGRFREQKFRLSKSGAGQIIYLIEDYNLEEVAEFGDAVKTAMSSIQMLNGYFLKRTATIDQSIDYLVRMTRMLKKKYENTSLYAIPDNMIYRTSFLNMKKDLATLYPDRTYLVTYSSYSDLNSKSKPLTLKDTFVRMLMTIRGISVDKAAEITKIYPTPRKLIEEFDSLTTENDKKKMIMNACNGIIRRKKIGPALSDKIYQIWFANNYHSLA
ncbi:7514_t:CDS:2 [Dentiscutata erythropus]|uniref:Crossover junction endonuclease MUS81 n=1 Tax=Dentiscutata erythropus TaxID=1348616 RepID=A0A9N8WUL3_9GLOM|nr:7514_t:CDS:2 [Dentiscutata erythropus]